MRLVLLVLVLGSICLYLNAQTTAHRELSDVSIMSFTIRKYQSSDAIQLENFSRDLSERRSSPKGKKFVVVSLVGQLEGLRKRYEFVLKDCHQFALLYDDETAKEAVSAFMIKGAVGAELSGWEPMYQILGKFKDSGPWEDQECFTVAFAVSSDRNQFRVVVLPPEGSGQFTSAGKIDLLKAQPSQPSKGNSIVCGGWNELFGAP